MKNFYDAYKSIFQTEPVSILEIGSRDGKTADDLRVMCNLEPQNVYIVEPHPESFKRIVINYPKFNVYPFAIYDKIGIMDFNAIPYQTNNDGLIGTSSLLKKNKEITIKELGISEEKFNIINVENWIKVLTISGRMLLQLINRHEIDMVKIDVEGATLEVLKSFNDDIRLLKMLHLELEDIPIWKNQHTTTEIKNYLQYYGFKMLYHIPVYWGGKQGDSVWVRM